MAFQPPGIKISPYEQVVNSVQSRFPELDKSQIDAALISLRQSRGNLRGFTVSTLIETLCDRIFVSSVNQELQSNENQVDLASGSANEPLTCVICTELMRFDNGDDVDSLYCGHRYHTKCIRSWFHQNKTCPQCRSYTLLQDEYPSLQ